VTAKVEAKRIGSGDTLAFEVTVSEGASRSSHRVTLDASYFERVHRGDESPERFVERCFDFLLVREPKESILSSFDVSVIPRYFPDFEEEISR
jgi:hypothetical protein